MIFRTLGQIEKLARNRTAWPRRQRVKLLQKAVSTLSSWRSAAKITAREWKSTNRLVQNALVEERERCQRES